MNRQESRRGIAVLEYVGLLVELEKLIAAGEDDSETADEVRDQMDAPWRRLNSRELEFVDRLAAELATLGSVVQERSADDLRTPDCDG